MKTLMTGIILFALATNSLFFNESVSSKEVAERSPLISDKSAIPRYALLVGINLYDSSSGIKKLSGTHNDVALMKSLLVENGFKEEMKTPHISESTPCGNQAPTSSIKTLCSAQATKKAIVDAFDNHLVGNAEAYWKGKGTPDPSNGPFVVFYYSGHGSQVPDKVALPGETESELVKDEADNLDETIVPHDSDIHGSRDIRDDLFNDRITKLRRFTTNIVVISDSCHSGTISRGGPGARRVEREFSNLGAKGEGEEVRDLPADNSYITISGSEPSQLSYEERVFENEADQQGVWNGLMTYYFVRHVRDYKGASYGEIMGLVQNSVAVHKGKVQTPQAEGDIERAVFSTEPGTSRKRAISIKCSGSGNASVCSEKLTRTSPDQSTYPIRKIKMDVGEIAGARIGGSVVVYSPETKELSGEGGKIATGAITYADAFRSEAEVVPADLKSDKDLPPLARVVLVSPNFGDAKRVVAIDMTATGGSDQGLASMKRLYENLRKSSSLIPFETTGLINKFKSVTQTTREWNLAVVRATFSDFKAGLVTKAASKERMPSDGESGYYISDAAGIPLYELWVPVEGENADSKILSALEKHVKAENVRVLANEASKLKGKLKVEMVRYKTFVRQTESRPCSITPYTTEEQKNMVKGSVRISRSEAFHLNITNTSTKPLHFYIYSIDSSGAVDLIYPPDNAQEQLVPGVTFQTTAGHPCWVFSFDSNAPTGKETLKILASETPIQAALLTQEGVRSSHKGAETPLEKLLRSVGSGTRGPSYNYEHVSDWITYNITYTVVP